MLSNNPAWIPLSYTAGGVRPRNVRAVGGLSYGKGNYMDIFESKPAIGAIVRDWTKKTLTVDLVNSLGEKFHFEVLPNEVGKLSTRSTDSPADKHGKTYVDVRFPIL